MQTLWLVPSMSGSSLQHIQTKGLHANLLASSIHVRFKSPTYTHQGATCKPFGWFHPCQVPVSNIYKPRGYMQTFWPVPSMSGSSLQHIHTKGLHANPLAGSTHIRFKSNMHKVRCYVAQTFWMVPSMSGSSLTCTYWYVTWHKHSGWFHPYQVPVWHVHTEMLLGTNILAGSIHAWFQFDMYILICYLAQTFWLVHSRQDSVWHVQT